MGPKKDMKSYYASKKPHDSIFAPSKEVQERIKKQLEAERKAEEEKLIKMLQGEGPTSAVPVTEKSSDRDFLRDSEGRTSIFRPSSWYAKTNKEKKEDTARRGCDPEKKKILDQPEGVLKKEERREETSYEQESSYEYNSTVKVDSKRSQSSTASNDSVLESLGSLLSFLFDKIKEFSNVLSEKFSYGLDTTDSKVERNQVEESEYSHDKLAEPQNSLAQPYTYGASSEQEVGHYDTKQLANSARNGFGYGDRRVEFGSMRNAPTVVSPNGNGFEFATHKGNRFG